MSLKSFKLLLNSLVSTTFDYTLGLWKILFSKQADSVIESTYLQVIGSNQIYVLGCSIAPTLFYSKFYGKINSVFLSSKKNLTGHFSFKILLACNLADCYAILFDMILFILVRESISAHNIDVKEAIFFSTGVYNVFHVQYCTILNFMYTVHEIQYYKIN